MALLPPIEKKRLPLAAKRSDNVFSTWYNAKHGKMEALQKALKRSRGVDELDEAGWTPLHHAAKGGQAEAVVFLIDVASAPIDAVSGDAERWTPLHLAARWGNVTTVRELLVRGATVDLRDAQGHTPEDLARQLQRLDILKQMKAWTSGKEDRQQPDGVDAASEPLQKLTIESNDSIASRSMEEVRGLDELSLRRRALQRREGIYGKDDTRLMAPLRGESPCFRAWFAGGAGAVRPAHASGAPFV